MESLSSESKSIALDILEDILSAIERLEERTKDINSIDDFQNSSSGMVLLDATCMLLIAIGESLKNLDKTTNGQLLPTYPSIPWKNVKGLRDIIAHHYFDVDASQILWIIKNEISPLKDAIRFFIKSLRTWHRRTVSLGHTGTGTLWGAENNRENVWFSRFFFVPS